MPTREREQHSRRHDGQKTMPSEVGNHIGVFDRFATHASTFVSRAWFFVVCVLLVVIWAPSFLVLPDIDTW